jgi:hypothetical protein
MLIGLCGSEGAGKSTIANVLTAGQPFVEPTLINLQISPLHYTYNIFSTGSELDISNYSDLISGYMKKFVDSNWDWGWCNTEIVSYNKTTTTKWRELTFAEPLKIICSVLFNYDMNIIFGQTTATRDAREVVKTIEYNICGALTGRQVLEYFGTNIMRNNFDDQIWIKIMRQTVLTLLDEGYKVVISDVRFANEKEFVKSLKGQIIVVIRSYDDLQNIDKTAHRAKWEFKTFLDENDKVFLNDMTIDLLVHEAQRLSENRLVLPNKKN